MVLPANANVYYAINTSCDLNFILRMKSELGAAVPLSSLASSTASTPLSSRPCSLLDCKESGKETLKNRKKILHLGLWPCYPISPNWISSANQKKKKKLLMRCTMWKSWRHCHHRISVCDNLGLILCVCVFFFLFFFLEKKWIIGNYIVITTIYSWLLIAIMSNGLTWNKSVLYYHYNWLVLHFSCSSYHLFFLLLLFSLFFFCYLFRIMFEK